MKNMSSIVSATVLLVSLVGSAGAAVIGGQNWADGVNDYSSNVQNYAGALMTAETTWWVTGPSDADVDGNGYGWDPADNDYVAGWRANAPDEYIIVQFNAGLQDLSGNDLVIHTYGGSDASASVLASTDGSSFTQIGIIASGTPGYFRDEAFDFNGLFASDVHYVKVLRAANGAKTGMFFDSFASVPEPATITLLVCGGAVALIRRRKIA